jgi:dienelactone hydrolase
MVAAACLVIRTWRSAALSALVALTVGCLLVVPARVQAQTDGQPVTGQFKFGGKTINYWQFEPKAKAKGPLPAILVIHGIEGLEGFDGEAGASYKQFCSLMASNGYVVYFVHYMDSTPLDRAPHLSRRAVLQLQNRIKASLLAPPNQEDAVVAARFKKWMACVNAALDYLKTQPNKVDKDRIGVVGLSMGGFLATALVVTEPKAFCPQAVAVAFGGLPPRLHDTKVGALPPIYMIAGEKDEIVPLRLMQDTCKCLKGGQGLVEFRAYDCYHMFTDKSGKFQPLLAYQALGPALQFFKEHVQKTK